MTAAVIRTIRRIGRIPFPILLGLALVLAVMGGLGVKNLLTQPISIPFPVPVYSIEAKSGTCNASIANLNIGYVGTLQAPVPVDVNCDLIPDVTVAVNLIDLEGPLNDPLANDSDSYQDFLNDRAGRTIAPNVEISRYPLDALSIILNKPSPPVRINVKLTVKDLEFQEPDTILRFGYETGEGGSIPTHFKTVLRGLEDFFNPLEAVIDTKGDFQGADTVPSYYEGPLTLIGGVATSDGQLDAKLDVNYSPFPDVVKLGYASDDDGHHIDYAHGVGEQILLGYGTALPDGTFEHYVPGELPEVDMSTKLDVVSGGGDTLNLTADVDRLPRRIGLDINTPENQGRLDYEASTDGRLPDARVNLRSVTGGELTRAQAHVEEIPPELHALWTLGNDDDISALFTTSDPDAPGFDLDTIGAGPGIGAIEVLYSNVDTPSAFTPFVATEQQFLNLQAIGGEQLLSGRIEDIRGISFDTRSDGFDVVSRVGDGALPLETNIQMDGLPETGSLLNAAATITPLPSSIDVNLFSGDKTDPTKPFKIVYDANRTVDVDATAELREPTAAAAACGEPGTVCADLGIRHLPAHMEVAIAENGQEGAGSTTNVAIDSVPRPGAPKPDIHIDAILGKLDSVADPGAVADAGPVILEASGVLRGIPDTVRLRFVEGADETLERLDVATCELDVTDKCPAGTDPIERVDVQIRNFRDSERADANVPHPAAVAPQFATLTARGSDNPAKTADPTVRFEVASRVRDITEVRYANVNGLFGVRSVVGDNRDLEVLLDIENVIFEGNDPSTGPVDLKGRALVRPLPAEIDLCLREEGFPLTLADSATFTDICESTDPLGDGSATDTPLTFAYDASSGFDVDASVDLKERGLTAGPADDHDIHGALVLDNVPSDLTAHIQMPPERPEGAPPPAEPERLRIRAIAPGATGTNLDFEFEDRFAGATCADPQPAGDITCAAGTVTGLPVWTSVVADTGPGDATKARVFACDLLIATDECRTGTDGLITETTARLRMVAGNPVEEGDLVPFVFAEHPYRQAATPATAYTLALRLDQDDTDNKELKAEARLAQFRSLSFDRSEAGFDIRTDLGDGKTPLLGSVAIDTRVPASAPGEDPATGKLIVADTRVDPLPQIITISQHGPGDNQQTDPLEISYNSTAPVDVDARAQIFDQVAGELCGDHGTMCATLALDRLPTTISAKISTFDEGVPDTPATTDVRRRMSVDLDAIPFGTVAPPDLTMDAAIGSTPEGDPPFDDTPIVAHAELHGFSEKARIRLAQTGTLLADDSLEDAAFEEALFVTCELAAGVTPPECDGPEFPIQEIAIAARNFHYRPTDFPVPRRNDVPDRNTTTPVLSDSMYAEAVARGDQFEAHAGFTNVREFRMRNVDDIIGVKVGGGDGQGFEAHGDLAGIVLPDEPLGDEPEDGVEERTLSVDATATLTNVPTEFAFCMRSAGAPIKALTGDFTEPCEEAHPFADPFFDATAPESGPLSIAYRANAEITQLTTTATAEILRREVVPGPMGIPDITALPTFHVFGDVTIDHLPQNLTVHLEMPPEKKDDVVPVEEGGPIRALFFYDQPPSAAPLNPVDITFEAEYTLGDAVCKDLRQDQTAFCFSGKLENLPSRVKAFVDPEAPLVEPGQTDLVQNLRIETSNTDPAQKMNLRNIKVSVVKQDDDPTKPPLVLVIDGDNDGGSILGLPSRVDGTIHMADEDPAAFDKPAFDIVASPPLDEVDLEVRNFVGADPLPEVAPPRGGASVDQSITFLQRGDFFKAIAKIKDVAGGGYKTGRNAAGQATETQLIRVDFGIPDAGPKPTIRGYVDLLTVDDLGNPTHVFADILLDDVPHGIDVCFRGEPPDVPTHDLTPAPGTEEFCDTVDPELGAFRFQGRTTGDPEPQLDVSAIFRMTSGSDTNVLKAVADVRNIPNVIEGTFGDGAVAVNAFKANGTTPAGIDDVVAEMADFDFQEDGYAAGSSPWGFDVPGTVILPAAQPGPAHEFARVASNGTDFHVKAHIGTAYDGSEGARITSFQLQPEHCAQPAGADNYFPHYPNDPANEYKCIRADLEAHSAHPLLLDADLVLDGTPLKILNAGLTQLPKYFQVTVAKTPTMAEKNGVPDVLRRRCGTAQVEPDTATDCMPPLLHFDSEGNAQLFGQLHLGNSTDLEQLRTTNPARTMADLEEHPVPPAVRDFDVPADDPDNWAEFPSGLGVRAKIGKFPGDRVAVRAGFRLDLPKALTVDQLQKWEFKDKSNDENWREASDLRFHYVLRNSTGIVGTAGELAAMVHEFSDNGQMLVSKVDNDLGGIPIPGEFGFDFYDRDYKGKGRRLLQIDLRTSTDLAARLRLVAGTGAKLGDSDFKLTGVRGVPAGDASYVTDPGKPSFRLRVELKDPADKLVPDPPDTSDWKDDLLCIVWCIATDVGAPELTAALNLDTDDSPPVRLLEAVVNLASDTKLGAEIRSHAQIDGTGSANIEADSPDSGANPFATGGIHVDIDPFNFFLHAGIPILASFDLLLAGEMNVDLNIATTDHFRLRMDTTEIKSMSAGADLSFPDLGSDTWLQVSEDPGVLAGFASLFWPFPPVYLWYAMGLTPSIPFTFHQCPTPAHAGPVPWTMPILPVEREITAFLPFTGPIQVIRGGPLQVVLDPLFILGGPPIMCAIFDAGGTALFSDPYLPPSHPGDRSPGDPIVKAGHPIPGLGITAAPVFSAPTPPLPPAPLDLIVPSGTKTLCGSHAFDDITVAAGAAINVGTVAFDDPATLTYVECPADVPDNPDTPEFDPVINVGRLHLTALSTFTINGTVNGPAGGNLNLTGTDLTVSGTGLVNVESGFVELFAGDELSVSGTIEANNIATTMPTNGHDTPETGDDTPWAALSTGNAGASHGGAGGAGTGAGGSVGPAYGSGVTDDVDPGTETGSPGASPDGDTSGGRGGGIVTLRGSEVFVSGTIQANGEGGESDFSGDCSVPDDPDVDGDQSVPNSGQAGAGGGSGGGIAIHGVTLDVTGLIQARGGSGGSGTGGAGGGGGGGVIRLNAGDVDTDADALDVGFGGKGFSSCPDDFDDGSDGGGGVVDNPETPRSHALATNQFWHHPDRLQVPYKAASAAIDHGIFGTSDDFDVYLCGINRGPEAVEDGDNFGLVMPTGGQPDASNPCGTKAGDQGDESIPHVLGSVTHANAERAVTGFSLDPSVTMDSGIWGLWTVAAHPEIPSFLCGFFGLSCVFEDNPVAPEVIVGIDPASPEISFTPLGTTTNADGTAVTSSDNLSLQLGTINESLPRADGAGDINLSGLDGFACYTGSPLAEVACDDGDDRIALTLPGNEGSHTVYVVAFDQAGNSSAPLTGGVPDVARFDDATADNFDDDRITVIVDRTPPGPGAGAITIPASPTGENGWHTDPPTQYRVDGFDDGADGSGEHAEGGFRYRFDGADWTPCFDPCVIEAPTPLPGPGSHTLYWKAVDGAGLESAESSVPILIDGTAPQTAVSSIPEFEAGVWITAEHPMVVARGVDEFGGSSVGADTGDDLCDGNPGTGPGKSGTCISLTGVAGPYVNYLSLMDPDTGAVELDSGTDQVICAYSVDVAGNEETPALAANCTDPLDIDNDDPTGSISIVPPGPTGDNGWYDGSGPVPTINLFNYNGTGSPEPAGGGFRYRIDNSFEQSCANPCVVDPLLLGEGSHNLHWTVVDTAGNRRPEQTVSLLIDIDDPRAHILVEGPSPNGANGWYVNRPVVTLVPFDEPLGSIALRPIGSGADAVNYTLDGNPFVYSGPFSVGPGDHNFCVSASDTAGNEEDFHCQRVAVDLANPTTSVLQNGSVVPVNDGDNGWYRLNAVTITQTSSDLVAGSGVAPQSLSAGLCDHIPDVDPAPAGVCISVDGRAPGATIAGPEFGPYTGAILLGEGEHVIRAFSVDNAGRRSAMDREVVLVDRSNPVSVGRLRAPEPSRVGALRPWWRHQPTLVLRAIDGDQNAGVRAIQYRFDGAGTIFTYTTPPTMPVGIHFVEHRAVDESGRVGPWRRVNVAVDIKPPVVKALSPNPSLWLYVKLLNLVVFGPEKNKLQWQISDDLSSQVRVRVIVYNELGLAVRHLDGGVQTVTPGVTKSGFTEWDGKDDSLIGFVPAGIYYYRVVAIDDAGNPAMSGESTKLVIKLRLVL